MMGPQARDWRTAMFRCVFLAILAITCTHGTQLELSDEMKEIIQSVHDECVAKTGTTEEDIKNCENGIFKEDIKLKCYMFCLMETANLIQDDGSSDYETFISVIPEQYLQKASNMILPCKHEDSLDKDKCQGAFDFHKCAYSRDPDVCNYISCYIKTKI